MKILIVDRTLEKSGYGTELADSAEKANEILNSGEPIILMICDLTMPGTDGWRFWRSFAARHGWLSCRY